MAVDEKQLETLLMVTEAMADEVADYLLGDNLYRQLFVRKTPLGTQQPKMTLGALLENLETLQWLKEQMTEEQRSRLQAAEEKVEIARRSFPDRWRNFLRRELRAVMGSWRWYLDDAARDREARENYPSEVHHRTRIDVIVRALASDAAIAEERRELNELDERLRRMLRTGSFVGPRDQAGRYSPQQAWWLYGRPREAK